MAVAFKLDGCGVEFAGVVIGACSVDESQRLPYGPVRSKGYEPNGRPQTP